MAEETNIWEHFQAGGAESFAGSESRLAFLASLFGRGQTVLNIGAGNGRFEELALARGADVYSLDPGPKTVQGLRARLGLGDKAAVGVSDKVPFPDAHFDAVVMSEVLEHLSPESMRATLGEVRRVLKPGGRFVGTVPCNEVLAEQETVCPKCGEKFHRWGHRQSFTPESMTAALGAVFSGAEAAKRLFVPWNVLNWKGKLQGLFNRGLFLAGLLGDARLNIFFSARR